MKTKLLIFGITGDLSQRKLLPALERIVESQSVIDLEVIGVSRRSIDVAALLGDSPLRGITRVEHMDIADPKEYDRLREVIDLQQNEQLLIYLSVPPRAATQIVDFLGQSGLNDARVKVLFEKPFGVDLVSAKEMIERTARYFKESQLYRIDHYVAKEMAQNIVTFRAHNALFAHVWQAGMIEYIEVNAFEQIDIEGRASFYEQAGALRDVLQGHLLQLLALVLMDMPVDMNWEHVPSYRQKALATLRPASPSRSLRAQYKGYRTEVNVPKSSVETFVSVELESDDPRWQGVPIRLTTGKALSEKRTEINIYFTKTHPSQTNRLTFRIQPNEGVEIALNTKAPGYENKLQTRELSFSYPEDENLPDAYEQVLIDAIRSRKSLFTTSNEIIRAWEVLQPLVEYWGMHSPDILQYEKGATPPSVLRHQKVQYAFRNLARRTTSML
jgi:glucose-6-phosphate 1-dehydrogenase